MKIKKVDDKPMVIHTKKKAKLHTHEPKKASIKAANIYTVDRSPKIKGSKIATTENKKFRRSTIHPVKKAKKGMFRQYRAALKESMLKQSGEYSMKETAAIFSELGRTMTEPDWAEVYLAGNKTLFMCYCRDESHLRAFLNKKFNDENVEDVRFDYERCSLECKEKIRLYGITENGEKDKMVEHHYSHMEHQFKQGENLHNFNGKDYKVVELLSPRNLLLMDMSNGNFVVGLGTSLFMRQIKGDNEEPEIGIEWEHGVYLSSKPSRIDFQGIREDYGGTKMEKDREDIRLEQEDYFTQLHKLANNPHCSEDIRELLSEIMRAEFCTDKMDKFHQNLSAGIYDVDSEMKVFPVTVSKDMESVLNVRGIDLEDAIEVATNVISMAEVHMDKQKAR